MFSDRHYWRAVSNTLWMVVVVVPLAILVAFLLAELLNQKLIGMITLDKKVPGFYEEQHASLAMAFAAQAAVALENAQVAAHGARQLVVQREPFA